MPSNVELASGTGGAIAATKQITHDGDTAQVQMVGLFGISGTEDAYAATLVNADSNGLKVSVGAHVPGTAATNLGKAEDAAHSSGDTGVFTLAVRQDTATQLAGTDGDYSPLITDANGRLHVVVPSHDVTNAGTFAVQAEQSGTWNVTNISGTVSLPTGASTAANQTTIIGHLDGVEGLLTTIDADTGTIAAAMRAEDAAHASGDTGVLMLAVRRDSAAVGSDTDGDNSTLNVNGSGRLYTTATVDAALPAGDNNIGNVDVVTLPNVTLAAGTNTNEVVGDVAHDAAASGNPVLVAGRATNSIEGLTQVAAADASYITTDLNGVVVTRPHTTLEEIISERVTDTGGTATAFTNFGAGGAGIHNYVTSITVWNSAATDGYVDIRDGAAGSVLATVPAPQTGGAHITFPVPLKGSANTALAYDVSGAISTVYITVVGFQAQG